MYNKYVVFWKGWRNIFVVFVFPMSRKDKSTERPLTAQVKRFVQEYLFDLNATKAALRAGYSPKSARQYGNKLLDDPRVQAAILAGQEARSRRVGVDQGYVLQRLLEIDQMDVLDIMNEDMSLRPVNEWPAVWRQYLSGFDLAELFEGRGDERESIGILKKIRWPDKTKNLELLGRHLGMFNRVEVSGPNGGPIQTKSEREMTDEELMAIIQGATKG